MLSKYIVIAYIVSLPNTVYSYVYSMCICEHVSCLPLAAAELTAHISVSLRWQPTAPKKSEEGGKKSLRGKEQWNSSTHYAHSQCILYIHTQEKVLFSGELIHVRQFACLRSVGTWRFSLSGSERKNKHYFWSSDPTAHLGAFVEETQILNTASPCLVLD